MYHTVDFISLVAFVYHRPGCKIWTILTSLLKVTLTFSLYKVLRRLHKINHHFINLPGLWTLKGLVTFHQQTM